MRKKIQTKDSEASSQTNSVRVSSIGWKIGVIARIMDGSMSNALKSLGVTVDQFKVIMTLREFEGLSQVEIGRKVNLPSYAITRLIDSMETSLLVERRPDEKSRRNFSIHLTRKGKLTAPKLFKAVDLVNKEVLAALSAKESKQLSQLLDKIVPDDFKQFNEN